MRVLVSTCVLCLVMSPVLATETHRFAVLVDKGIRAGHQVVTQEDDGLTRVDYVFKDNGRGPELKEEYRLAADGTFEQYRVKGTTTFGAPVDESYSRVDGRAQWKTLSDKGDQPLQGAGQYIPLSGSPQAYAVGATALLRRKDGKLPLLPSGTLSARTLAQMKVDGGSEQRNVQLIAVTGVGMVPNLVWTTTGAEPRMFAYLVPGMVQIIEEGWEKNAAAMEVRQKQAEDALLVDMHKRVSHPLQGDTLIRNARVFDSESAQLGAATDVLIRDGRIVSVGPVDKKLKPAQSLDAGGKVLLPGLFDMHAHMDRWSGGLDVAAGVTSVRDMGNDNATLQQIIVEENAGSVLMPRIVPAGFLEGESPMSARNGFVIKNLDEAKHAVDWYAEHHYPQIKIYNSFPRELLKDTAAYAHSKGLRVSGHVPAFMRARDVVEQGYDEIQHINQLLLNFLVDDKTDTRTLQRFYLPAEKVAGLDFDSKPVQDFIALLAQRQTVIDPTLATFNFLRQRSGEMAQNFAAVADHLPPDVQRGLRSSEMNIPDDATAARYTRSYEKMIEMVGRLYRAGVPLVAGTDEMPGFTLQQELVLYVQAGLTPAQVLQIATRNGAKYSRVQDDRGRIVAGQRADMVLIDGDPTRDIADIRKVALVIKGDRAYYPSEIYEALGIKPFATPARLTTMH